MAVVNSRLFPSVKSFLEHKIFKGFASFFVVVRFDIQEKYPHWRKVEQQLEYDQIAHDDARNLLHSQVEKTKSERTIKTTRIGAHVVPMQT